MPKTDQFNSFAEEYEEWFDKERKTYEMELDAVRKLLPEKGKGIEIGSGTGRFSLPTGIRIGVEPSHSMGRIALEKGLDVIEGVAESLPVVSNSFDFVLFNTVICFLDSLRSSLLECYRILRPGGVVLVGFIDKESYLGNIYNKKKDDSRFFKKAVFYSVPEVKMLLEESGYHSFEFVQTLIHGKKDKFISEKILSGYGVGSYVVIKGIKNF